MRLITSQYIAIKSKQIRQQVSHDTDLKNTSHHCTRVSNSALDTCLATSRPRAARTGLSRHVGRCLLHGIRQVLYWRVRCGGDVLSGALGRWEHGNTKLGEGARRPRRPPFAKPTCRDSAGLQSGLPDCRTGIAYCGSSLTQRSCAQCGHLVTTLITRFDRFRKHLVDAVSTHLEP